MKRSLSVSKPPVEHGNDTAVHTPLLQDSGMDNPPTSTDSSDKEREMLRDKMVRFPSDGQASTSPPSSSEKEPTLSSSPATPDPLVDSSTLSPSPDAQSSSPPVGDFSIGTSDTSPDSDSSPVSSPRPPWKTTDSGTTDTDASPGTTESVASSKGRGITG